jgi:hypothetical protein
VAERLQEIEAQYSDKVVAAYTQAKEAASKRIASARDWSIPAPGSEPGKPDSLANISVKDATEDLAIQARADGIRKRIENRKPPGKNVKQTEDPRKVVLREEFSKALQGTKGDTESRLGYLAALRVAEETLGIEQVLGEFRTPRHQRYAEEHQQLAEAAQAIPSGRTRQSIFPTKPRRNVAGGPLGQTPGMRRSAGGGGPTRRKPPWK